MAEKFINGKRFTTGREDINKRLNELQSKTYDFCDNSSDELTESDLGDI